MEQAVSVAKRYMAVVTSNSDLGAIEKLAPLDPAPVDFSAIGAAKIDKDQGSSLTPDQRMIARDLLSLEQDIIAGAASDSNLIPGQAHSDALFESTDKDLWTSRTGQIGMARLV